MSPDSRVVKAISPTGFAVMRSCRLRIAFGQAQSSAVDSESAPQALGDLCHTVLERLAQTREIQQDDWRPALESQWEAVSDEVAERVRSGPHDPELARPPQEWPGYALKRARLSKAA